MEITEVKVFPVYEERLKAYVTITMDHCFIVRDLKVIHGNNGLFVAMPSKKRKDGTFRDIAHPLNSECRDTMESVILDAYRRETSDQTHAAEGVARGLSATEGSDRKEAQASKEESGSNEG